MAGIRFACYKSLWKSKAPPHCKFFIWLVIHKKCLTANNLQKRGWPSNRDCPLSSAQPENCAHLFVHCGFTQQLWNFFKQWSRVDFPIPDSSFDRTEDWWLAARRTIPKQARRNFDTIASLIHWRIWKERNARIFQHTACNIERVLDLIREDIGMWRAAGCVADLAS